MDFILVGGILLDGTGADPLDNAAVYVKNGRIAWVGAASDMSDGAKNAPHEDTSGKWILPGLIDAHIHVCYNGAESIFALMERDRDLLVLEAVDIVGRILSHGTTTVRDIGGEKYIEMS